MSDQEKPSRLEELTKRLYGKGDIRRRAKGALKPTTYGVSTEWQGPAVLPARPRAVVGPQFFRKFFIFSIIFFILAGGYAFYRFYRGANTVSNENIDITIIGNAFTPGGEELPLQIEITNKNAVPLEYADLLVEYPKGSAGETAGDFIRIRRSLGGIPAGSTRTEPVKVTLFGEQGSNKEIKATLEYRVADSNAIFVKENKYFVTLSSAPVTLSVDAPKEIVSNQEMTFTVKVLLNATKVAENMRLKVDFPPGFEFRSASPKPVMGDNIWDLGDLSPNAEKKIAITGVVIGADGEERSFHAFAGAADENDPSKIGVVFNSLSHAVIISKPVIAARLLVNGREQESYSVNGASPVRAQIRWSNNLPTRIEDISITAKLSGNALDMKSIMPSAGFYNSLNKTITWDKNTSQDLAAVEPGDSGFVDFEFDILPLLGSGLSMLQDPEAEIEVGIRARQPAEGNLFIEINNFEKKIIRVNTDLSIGGLALFRTGAFQNTGPLPPKVGSETTYTIIWTVTNTANSVSGAEARAVLAPFNVRFVGPISPSSETLSYNDFTKEVVWKLGSIGRGTGIGSDPREVSFQVALQPSSSQVGSIPVLIGETTLSGLDTFTNSTVSGRKGPINIRLTSDPGFSDDEGRVAE